MLAGLSEEGCHAVARRRLHHVRIRLGVRLLVGLVAAALDVGVLVPVLVDHGDRLGVGVADLGWILRIAAEKSQQFLPARRTSFRLVCLFSETTKSQLATALLFFFPLANS